MTGQSDNHAACRSKVRKDGYYAPDRQYLPDGRYFDRLVFIPNRSSVECRYDMRPTDPKCAGCEQP